MPPAGSLRVNGTDLEWVDEFGTTRSVTGVDIGATSVPSGALWVNTSNDWLMYVDANGDERRITADGVVSDNKTPGGLAVFLEDLRYIDQNGDVRFIVPPGVLTEEILPIVDPDNTFGGWTENGDGDGDFADEIDDGDTHDGTSTYISWSFVGASTSEVFSTKLEPAGDDFREFQSPNVTCVSRMSGVSGSPSYDLTIQLWDGEPSLGSSTKLEERVISGLTQTTFIAHSVSTTIDKIRNESTLFIRVVTDLNVTSMETATIEVTAVHISLP